jgi:hypothetical protein
MQTSERIRALLRHHGLDTAARHFELAESAFDRGEWESANAQMRSYLEAIFEGAAKVLLRWELKGGMARKRLSDEGILEAKEAEVVRSVMSLAHERGSHAGRSEPEEAHIRRLLGQAVALMGLSLLPDLVRVQDVLAAALTAQEGGRLATGPGDILQEGHGVHHNGVVVLPLEMPLLGAHRSPPRLIYASEAES